MDELLIALQLTDTTVGLLMGVVALIVQVPMGC